MIGKYSQFYFTEKDPDYNIKGSRDPLGFQVLWQHQGKKLISFLSTASSNIHDFQILCLAYFIYGQEPDIQFGKFFIRFEQLMAYARYDPDNIKGFNGIDGIKRKLKASSRIRISNNAEDEILSNQRAYGIWGKYNRPFQDINFLKRPGFQTIFEEKFALLVDRKEILNIIGKIQSSKEQSAFNLEEVKRLFPLLTITPKEMDFYINSILQVDHPPFYQNDLFHFVSQTKLPDKFHLYSFLSTFSEYLNSSKVDLKNVLEEFLNTERVLCPLNRIFRYLQSKPHWERGEIMSDPYIEQCKTKVDYYFHEGTEQSKTKNHLIDILHKDNWELAVGLVERNKEVSTWREGAAWISVHNNLLEVHHADGNYHQPDFNPNVDFDNGYFIDTYLSLYRQILQGS